ncbi:hypothetical protein HYH03_005645 [Edaphochlamys debaryana]|uniref:SGNH hydrolase-type esterase domain-containing protein n=1 Tax=Edaphochlamys debaryana TaxID=47281 RepID=A0A836C2B6_9CHLO|nr:hypothetical protein HYH03_005645 [Edaphochlamys debaryana]|eukprot:KAG2496419.1 hypothetical protein HYH03_005645 [Edaphochlamys debaryana]
MRRTLTLLALLLGSAGPSGAVHHHWKGLDAQARTQNRPELDWDWGHTWSDVEVRKRSVSSLLSSLFNNYKFTLPKQQLLRGTGYLGASARLRKVVRELLMPQGKKDFKIAAIGGSITYNSFASKHGVTDWFSVFSQYMINAFPKANITLRNGAIPGVESPYMILCLELSVDPDVDLVFVEFTLNDGPDPVLYENKIVKQMERLVRRIMALPSKPAVVLMQVPTLGMAGYPPEHPKFQTEPGGRWWYARFWQTSEDAQSAIAHYYDAQYLSLRTATYHLAAHRETPGFQWEDMFVDRHPGDHGHKIMADLAVHMIQRTAIGLLFEPLGPADEELASEALPPPMYPGNTPPSSPMCVVGSLFKEHVVLREGFEWIVEGTALKPKPGYIANATGSRLQVKVDTDRSVQSPGEKVGVFFHHLKSYEHMGVADFSCVSGCECTPLVTDAHIKQQVSQVYFARLDVTQSKECVIQVKVLEQTSSGERKFKVSGVVVSDQGGSGGMENIGDNDTPFGVKSHAGERVQVVWKKDGRIGGVDRENH